MRVAAAQAARASSTSVSNRTKRSRAVEKNLAEWNASLIGPVQAKCDALVLPEDTPGLLNWVGSERGS